MGKQSQQWAEWLSDSPPPQEVRRIQASSPRVHDPRGRLRRAGAYHSSSSAIAPSTNASTGLSIQISIPKFKLPRLNFRQIKKHVLAYSRKINRQLLYGVTGIALVGIVGLGAWVGLRHFGGKQAPSGAGASGTAKVDFKPLTPKDDKDQANRTGSAVVTPRNTAIYQYQDMFFGRPITVSQQALPESFSKDPRALKKVADGAFGEGRAAESIETARGTAYVATNAEANTQLILFVADDKLVMVQSPSKRDTDDWKYYIETLR